MRTLDVALGERSYPIHIGAGLLRRAGALLAPLLPRPRAVIVSNPVVAALWLDPLRASLAAAGIDAEADPHSRRRNAQDAGRRCTTS